MRPQILHVDSRRLALHFRPTNYCSVSDSLGAMDENVIFSTERRDADERNSAVCQMVTIQFDEKVGVYVRD